MSWLDFIFGPANSSAIKSFRQKKKLNRQDIINLVWSIKSLDQQQKELVKLDLLKQLDDGGVSKYEYEQVIRRLAKKRIELGLSEIDIENLREVF